MDKVTAPVESPGLTVAIDVAFLRQQAHVLYYLRSTGQFTEPELRELFLQQTIGSIDLCFSEGLDVRVGHLLYRLTDLMDPCERGTIVVGWSNGRNVTVNDWRHDWEKSNPGGIPAFDNVALAEARRAIGA